MELPFRIRQGRGKLQNLLRTGKETFTLFKNASAIGQFGVFFEFQAPVLLYRNNETS
jgi:hypothetical protein